VSHAERLFLVVAVAAAMPVAGCSLFVSLDGYTGGAQPAGGVSGEAGVPEGGADGGPAVRFCDSLPRATTLVCNDFDGPDPVTGWRLEGPSPPVVDGAFASSPSSSVLCNVKALASGQTSESSLRFDFAPVPRVRARWSMFRESSATSIDFNMGSFYFSDGARYVLVQLQVRPDGTIGLQEYGEPGPNGKPDYSAGPPETVMSSVGKWMRITLSVDWKAPGGPGVSATVDDAPLFTDYKMAGAPQLGTIVETFHRTGITYVGGPRGETRLRIDDVAVETF
jgi:hypothetical protein